MKSGEECYHLSRLADEPSFGLLGSEMHDLLDPSHYIGRCAEQVDMLPAKIQPLLAGIRRETAEFDL